MYKFYLFGEEPALNTSHSYMKRYTLVSAVQLLNEVRHYQLCTGNMK